jgi:hypothetical protein
MKTADRIAGILFILATCGHTAGTLLGLPAFTGLWVWSLGASLCGFVLGALNLLRAGRPNDRAIALITSIAMPCWVFVALSFNYSIGNMLDPRGFGHSVIAAALTGFSLRTLLRSGRGYEREGNSFSASAA